MATHYQTNYLPSFLAPRRLQRTSTHSLLSADMYQNDIDITKQPQKALESHLRYNKTQLKKLLSSMRHTSPLSEIAHFINPKSLSTEFIIQFLQLSHQVESGDIEVWYQKLLNELVLILFDIDGHLKTEFKSLLARVIDKIDESLSEDERNKLVIQSFANTFIIEPLQNYLRNTSLGSNPATPAKDQDIIYANIATVQRKLSQLNKNSPSVTQLSTLAYGDAHLVYFYMQAQQASLHLHQRTFNFNQCCTQFYLAITQKLTMQDGGEGSNADSVPAEGLRIAKLSPKVMLSPRSVSKILSLISGFSRISHEAAGTGMLACTTFLEATDPEFNKHMQDYFEQPNCVENSKATTHYVKKIDLNKLMTSMSTKTWRKASYKNIFSIRGRTLKAVDRTIKEYQLFKDDNPENYLIQHDKLVAIQRSTSAWIDRTQSKGKYTGKRLTAANDLLIAVKRECVRLKCIEPIYQKETSQLKVC